MSRRNYRLEQAKIVTRRVRLRYNLTRQRQYQKSLKRGLFALLESLIEVEPEKKERKTTVVGTLEEK